MKIHGTVLLLCLSAILHGSSVYGQRVYATDETSGGTGNAKIDHPEKSVDNTDLDDETKLEVKGLLSSAYQTLWFPGTVKKNTPVMIRLMYKTDLVIFGGITIQPMMDLTPVAGTFKQTTPLTILSSEAEEVLTLIPAGNFNGIRIELSGLLGTSKAEINYAYYLQDPVVNVVPDPVCAGDPAQLQVMSTAPGLEYRLYTSETAASHLIKNTSGFFLTPPVSAETTFYAETAELLDGSVSRRVPVIVHVSPKPALAVIPARNLCQGESLDLTTLNPVDLNGSTNGTYEWSASPGGSPLLTTTITPFIGTATYWVRYTANGCPDSESVTITTMPKPIPITVSVSTN